MAPRLVRTDLELQPVMVICGEERSLVDSAVRHVRNGALSGGIAELNHDRLSGKQVTAEEILACARTLPAMAPRRLVEVTDGEALGAEILEKVADYAGAPVPEAVLLIVARDIDGRTRAARALDAAGCLFRYRHLDERDLIRFCHQRAKGLSLELDEEAASVLVMAVGNELQLVERALEKLSLVERDGRVGVAEVEEHVTQTRVESIFKLTEAISRGEAGAALLLLGQMLEAREAPLRILATLAWQQRQLVRAHDLLGRGRPPREVLREVKVFRNGDRFLRQVRAASPQQITAGLAVIAQADRRLKSSRAPQRTVLEQTVLSLASLR